MTNNDGVMLKSSSGKDLLLLLACPIIKDKHFIYVIVLVASMAEDIIITDTICLPRSSVYSEAIDVGTDGTCPDSGLHKLWYPVVRDRSTWSKFGAHGEHGDVFLFSNLGAL